jgi:hypothetical protein
VWKYSGSNKWELVLDKNGVKVYALKAPGSSLKQFKAVRRVKTTLNRAMGPMVKTDVATCAEWIPGCDGMEIVEPWNPQELSEAWLWHVNFPSPFSPREFLIKAQFIPDPQSKAVRVEVVASPDKLPRNGCCFRVVHMHNSWRFTTLENGELEVECLENVDMGIPYWLFNLGGGQGIYGLFSKLPVLLNEGKYQDERFEFVEKMMAENS